jgi:hypothetical protein
MKEMIRPGELPEGRVSSRRLTDRPTRSGPSLSTQLAAPPEDSLKTASSIINRRIRVRLTAAFQPRWLMIAPAAASCKRLFGGLVIC